MTYESLEGWPVGGHDVVRAPVVAEPLGDVFFPCLGVFASKSLEAALFFLRGEETPESPPRFSSFVEVLIPPVQMCNV